MTLEALLLAAGLTAGPQLAPVDGDTVRDLRTGLRLRLESIDAPELRRGAECVEEAALGARAAAMAERLLPHVVAVEWSGRVGGWNRPLVTLRLADGRSLGEALMAAGLAVAWTGARADWCS